MTEFWQFALLGLGLSPAFAFIAQSLVLIHKGSDVVNFAAAGIAILGAYGYYGATQAGIPPGVALLAGLAVGAASGALIDVVVMRRLQEAPQLIRVIATLGIASIVIVTVELLTGSNSSPLPPELFHDSRVVILGGVASGYRLGIFAVSVVVTAVLSAVYKWTPFGLRTAAVAENRRAAAALGYSPQRIGLSNWALGGMLAALAGILVTPLISINGGSAEDLIAPALAAALLGRFASFWLSLLGAIVVAIGQSEITHYSATWGLGPGWETVAPFLLVIVILMLRSSSLPERGHVLQRLPGIGTGRVRPRLVVTVVIVLAAIVAVLPTAGEGAVTTTAASGIILVSFVVVSGYAGQISLAQAGLAGVGAFIAARLGGALGLGFWPTVALGILGTLPIGAIVGLPALRARGVNLAIVTLGFGLIIEEVLLANPTYVGGLAGLAAPSPSIFGFALDGLDHPGRYATMCLLALAVVMLLVANLRRGRVGRLLIAVRGNERAAASLGINVMSAKLYAFTLASGIAATGGILLAFQSPYVLFQGFDTETSITMLTFIVIGGLGYLGGAIFGAMAVGAGVLAWLTSLVIGSGQINNWLAVLGGIGVVATVIALPDGIAALEARRWGRLLDKITRTASPGKAAATSEPAQSSRADDSILTVENISVRFGGVVALRGVSFDVRSGEVLGLIGPNGAGKTTIIDAITGYARRYTGSASLNGESIDSWSAANRARAGIIRSFQSLELFDDLSVEDNLRVASEQARRRHYLTDLIRPGKGRLPSSAVAAIEEFGLCDDLAKRPPELSYGRRRLVAIARAVAVTQASILLLDEPAAGLDERESKELGHLLRRLATEWNLGIVLVEHDMNLVMNTCDRLVALNFGAVIAVGPTHEVRNDPDVITAYLGSDVNQSHADRLQEQL